MRAEADDVSASGGMAAAFDALAKNGYGQYLLRILNERVF